MSDKQLISKELLSEVLGDEVGRVMVIKDLYYYDLQKWRKGDTNYSHWCNISTSINIYELAHHKCKEWAKLKNVFDEIDWSEEPEQIFKKAEKSRNKLNNKSKQLIGKTVISQKLLSAVLGYPTCTEGYVKESEPNIIYWGMIGCRAIDDCEEYEEGRDIDKLTRECKEWILDNYLLTIHSFFTDTEAIFKAGQWLFDKEDKKMKEPLWRNS